MDLMITTINLVGVRIDEMNSWQGGVGNSEPFNGMCGDDIGINFLTKILCSDLEVKECEQQVFSWQIHFFK